MRHSRRSLPVRLMNTVSRVGLADRQVGDLEAVALGDLHDAREHGRRRRARRARRRRHGSPRRVASSSSACSTPASSAQVAGGDDPHGGIDADRALQPGRRVERDDPTLVDDGDPVAELVGLLHVVRGQQDRLPVDVELAEDLPQRDAALRVEARPSARRGTAPTGGASRRGPPSAAAPCRPTAPAPGRSHARRAGTARAGASPRPCAVAASMPKKRPWK